MDAALQPLDDGVNSPFFDKLQVTSVSDILKFTAEATGFMGAFTHLQPKYAKLPPDPEIINACTIAAATGIETKKMKEITDVNDHDLDRDSKNFIRQQTLYAVSCLGLYKKIMRYTPLITFAITKQF